MKKILASLVAFAIFFVMVIISSILRAVVDSYLQSHVLSQTSYVLIGLIKLLPLIIAVWLIKLSWSKITSQSNQKNTNSTIDSDDEVSI